ncbi:30S ribosomal protein S16, chloroplastic [Tetrabaena socialis]|uniref:30S ribosomal protein S16, chloroplastic n=1 Tax=Tetrabaena socialis TaxID=47790 RepID=A0A2J7ZZS8_9CHLO|nr:30S ribosomal protein S16, chloroplastic [Tetrabaena socialis]|eukprot:PNH05774.1 30S ribosomal protein S16, chloroplastic [Tetrabaena socialis]
MQALYSKPFTASRVAAARPARVNTVVVENRVALRFQRFGRKKLPFYRLVAIDSKKRRDGEPLEYLGWYDPLKKETNLNAPAIKEWLTKGAQPSETVENLLRKAFVMEPKVRQVVVPKDAVKV